MGIYGRQADLQRLHDTDAGFVVVIGDSGVGKSTLIGEAARNSRSGWITAPVTNLRSAPGQLHNSLIAQLTAILDAYLDDRSTVDATLQFLSAAAKRLGAVGGKELARVVGAEMLNLLKSRLGPEFGEAIGNMTKDILQTGDESLRQRLENSSELGTVEIVLKFAEEIVKLTNRNLCMVLDRAERLSPGDKGILLDMAEMLPERVQVVVGLSTAAGEDQTFPARLASNGASIIEVLPVSLETIRDWLIDANINQPPPDVFLRVTSGYPLFMVEAVSGAQSGLQIENIQTAFAFQELMKTSWNQLSIHAKTAARKLAVFSDCPPDEFIVEMLQVDQNAWSAVRDELLHRRIFVFDNEQGAWFHDRRRDLLWRTIMNSSDRDEAASLAMSSLDSWLRRLHHTPLWAAACLPELSQTDTARSQYPQIASVSDVSRDSMAVLFSLLELMEPNRETPTQFVQTPLLLRYASEVVGVHGDSVDALQELEEAGFAFTKSNESVSISTARIPDALTYAAILGRMTREFGRWMVPSIASNIFEQHFRPLVSPFTAASFGMGSLSLNGIADSAQRALAETGTNTFGRAAASLAVTARLGNRPFHAGIAFQTTVDRDEAEGRLMAAEGRIMEEPLTICSLHRLPMPVIRSQRFKTLFKFLGLLDESDSEVGQHPYLRYAQLRVDALEAVRRMMTEIELSASDLLEARSILVDLSHEPSSIMEIRLSGDTARMEIIDCLGEEFNPFKDPLFGFKLQRNGVIRADETIRGWTLAMTSESSKKSYAPFAEVADEVTSALETFNKFQVVERIPLDASYLEEQIASYRRDSLNDAQTLLAAGIGDADALSAASSVALHIVLFPSPEPWESYGATCLKVSNSAPSVTVTVSDSAPSRESLNRFFDSGVDGETDVTTATRAEYAFASDLLAELLGYSRREIRLMAPSSLDTASGVED